MRTKRVRTKLFSVWLHPRELDFLNQYAEDCMLTASEVIRALLHEVMKREGHEIKEPSLPETKLKKKGRK